MATPNVGILTNAGKNLIDQVNAGQTKITFSKIAFSSMDNSQLTDDQVKALTAITPQEVVVNNPEVTLDKNTGETRIRATGTNEALTDGVYVKTYAVYAKDDSGNEILYGITVSPNPNYLPEYDGVTPQAVTYSYKVNISNTSNITFTNSNDVYVSETDLAEALQPYAKTVDVNQQLDKKVNVADMRKPASDVAGIEEVNAKQDVIGYTPADDSKVAHLSGANNFDTVPTVNDNPLLLASSLPSDLARTGQSQTFTQPQTFNYAPTVTDTSTKKEDNQVALMGDLKSVINFSWLVIPSSWMSYSSSYFTNVNGIYKISGNAVLLFLNYNIKNRQNQPLNLIIDFSSIISGITEIDFSDSYYGNMSYSGNKIIINSSWDDEGQSSNTIKGVSLLPSGSNSYAQFKFSSLVN